MYCCSKCFASSYLRNIINSDKREGNCSYCKSKNVSVYSPRELIPFFRNILNCYKVDEESKIDLTTAIDVDFNNSIFSKKIDDKSSLLKAIAQDEIDEFRELFSNNVNSIFAKSKYSEQSQAIHSIWESFKDEIKNINRFHIENIIDLKKLKNFFENETFINNIKKGRIFYRSRISDQKGIEKEKMGNPPKDKATAGRANPKGISYLYLADEVYTSLYEARATLYDYVSVGDFKLLDDIKILNLRDTINDPISWAEQEAIDDYLIYIPFIRTLQKELSLPIRRLDKEIDYLPTQYLSEFIKSIGFDGVEFQSSLYSNGYNLAIFQPEKFECLKVKVYEIKDIKLQYNLAK